MKQKKRECAWKEKYSASYHHKAPASLVIIWKQLSAHYRFQYDHYSAAHITHKRYTCTCKEDQWRTNDCMFWSRTHSHLPKTQCMPGQLSTPSVHRMPGKLSTVPTPFTD